MTAGYQPDWLHCDLKRSRAFPGTERRHSEPFKQLLFVWTHWIDTSVITCKADAGRAITLTGDRVMRENGRGKPESSTRRTGSILPEWSRDMDRNGMGMPLRRPRISRCAHTICHPSRPCPTDPVSCPEHVTHFDVPLLAAESGRGICFSTLRQIASANLSDGWFPEKIWGAGSPKPWQQAPHQWIIMIINITRQGVQEKRKKEN